MRDCPEYTVSKAVLSGEVYWGCTVGQKGGFAVAEKAVWAWILHLASHQRKCGRACYSVGNKDKFSYGKSNAPLQSVLNCGCHSLFREGNYERGRKGTPCSSGQPVKTGGHSFQNKINLLKKCLRKLAFAYDFLVCGCS